MFEITASEEKAVIKTEKDAIDYINNFPDFGSLSHEQKAALAQFVAFNQSADNLKRKAIIAKYNFDDFVSSFIASRRSPKTAAACQAAISEFINYSRRAGFDSPLSFVSYQNCDNYILSLTQPQQRLKEKDGKVSVHTVSLAPASIRQRVACLSSLFSFIERQTEGNIKNCFRASSCVPKNKPVRINSGNKFYKFSVGFRELEKIKQDIEKIKHVSNTDKGKDFALIVSIMENCGLRAGAFSSFEYCKNKFLCQSKGKQHKGTLPPEVVTLLHESGKPEKKKIFAEWTDSRLCNYFKFFTKKLYSKKEIQYPYSCHDMRHYFAIRQDAAGKKLIDIQRSLGHTSVAITEKYLLGLNIDL